MDSLSAPDTMEINIENFGPIIEGRLDLRPLTVLVGPSNTGKSYLAVLIYAMHKFFGGHSTGASRRHLRQFRSFRIGKQQLSEKLRTDLRLLEQRILSPDQENERDRTYLLSDSVMDAMRAGLEAQAVNLTNEINRCFGISASKKLIRIHSRNKARVILGKYHSFSNTRFEYDLTIGKKTTAFRALTPREFPIRIDASDRSQLERWRRVEERILFDVDLAEEYWQFSAQRLLSTLTSYLVPDMLGPLNMPAFYLPADRTGVMHAHNVVVSALIERATMAGLRPATETPMLSGVMADFLEQLIDLDRTSRRRQKRSHKLAMQMEEAILDGLVRVEESPATGYPRFTYMPKGWEESLPLMNASSMVSEVAPVILYLRYMVGIDNLLIVEEPESHLHPALQVEFTRWLAAIVRLGIRVIITTHSEWILEELANVVRRSELEHPARKEMEFGQFYLKKSQVGAWLFEPSGRTQGSRISEIELGSAGLYPSGFESVAAALHNEWANIEGRIGGRNGRNS